MFSFLSGTLTIFLSSFLFYNANGVLSLYLPLHLSELGVDSTEIAYVMSCFAAGMLLASVLGGRMIQRSSHIRVFAASGSMAALVVLLYASGHHLFFWGALRILTGFSATCASIVIESWIQDIADPNNRSKLVGSYMVVFFLAYGLGQLIPGFDWRINLFLFTGVLFVLSILPLSLSKLIGPEFHSIKIIAMRELWKTSPIGLVGTFVSAMTYMSLIGLGSIFTQELNLNVREISWFMFAVIMGAFVMQYPVGKWSDSRDRRWVLVAVLCSSTFLNLAAIYLLFGAGEIVFRDYLPFILIAAGLVGGTTSLVFPLSMAITFDWIDRERMVNAMALCYMVYGAGGVVGPIAASIIMQSTGNPGLLIFILVTEVGLLLFTLHRLRVRKSLPVEEQESFVPFSGSESGILSSLEYDDSHIPDAETDDGETGETDEDGDEKRAVANAQSQ